MGSQNPKINTKERKTYLDVARTLAIISISLNHAVNRSFDNYSNQQAQYLASGMAATLIKTVFTIFSRIGVPLFLMITGVLILNKTFETSRDLKKFYTHNISQLFITTEIWYIIMYWFIIFFNPSVTVLKDEGVWGAVIGMLKTMLFIDQRTCGSMWYMPMILCLYMTLPFWAVVIKKFDARYICFPLVVSFLSFMVLPSLNTFRMFQGKELLTTVFSPADSPSIYIIYILVGFWLGNGGLSKLKDWMLLTLAVTTFVGCCAYQWYAYSQPANYLVAYSSPGILLTAIFVFAYLRRKEKHFVRFKNVFAYFSKISFAIYFVHILIMEIFTWYFNFSKMYTSIKMIFLETVSMIGSVLVIALLSKIKLCKKYLFMIKD